MPLRDSEVLMAHTPREFATASASIPGGCRLQWGADVVPVVSHGAATRVMRGGEMRR